MTTKKKTELAEEITQEIVEEVKMVKIKFLWNEFTPDVRAYKPSAPKLIPQSTFILLEVPLEYIAEFNDKTKEVILTLDGMRFVINQFESVMQPKQERIDDGWDDEGDSDSDEKEKEGSEDSEEGWDGFFDSDDKSGKDNPDPDDWGDDDSDDEEEWEE